jgi:hypothetical protein
VILNQKTATFISCLTYFSVTISIRNGGLPVFLFATNRVLSTLVGVGIALLIVPIFAMCVDVYFNHTITINLSDMAAYIVAVAGIFGAAGLTNAWTEYSYQRYNKNIFSEHQNTESCNGTSIEINNEYRNDI